MLTKKLYIYPYAGLRCLSMFCMLLFLTTCGDKAYPKVSIEEELIPYFERFKVEAEKRGVDFDINEAGIDGKIAHILTDGVLGYCNRDNNDDNHLVTISKPYWDRSNDLEREYVVFHELGHCLLKREHYNETDSLGVCKSMMAAGTSTCHVHYNYATRSRLLDEMFKMK